MAAAAAPNRITTGGAGTWWPPLDELDELDELLLDDELDDELDEEPPVEPVVLDDPLLDEDPEEELVELDEEELPLEPVEVAPLLVLVLDPPLPPLEVLEPELP